MIVTMASSEYVKNNKKQLAKEILSRRRVRADEYTGAIKCLRLLACALDSKDDLKRVEEYVINEILESLAHDHS